MIKKLNGTLRKLFIAAGAIFALFKLLEKVDLPKPPEVEDFQIHEFDDIW